METIISEFVVTFTQVVFFFTYGNWKELPALMTNM
jgi:hypothetical protein